MVCATATTSTRMRTIIFKGLHALHEAPWGDLKGKALDHRGLARRLREYGIKPRTICMGRGYPARL
jgi:hypothetical protein